MRYAPLTLTTLASLVPPEIPADIRILDEGVDEIDPDAHRRRSGRHQRDHRDGSPGL